MPDNVRVSGVELVLRNLGGFISGLKKVETHYDKVDKVGERMARRIEALGVSQRNASRSFEIAARRASMAERAYDAMAQKIDRLASVARVLEGLEVLEGAGKLDKDQVALLEEFRKEYEKLSKEVEKAEDVEARYASSLQSSHSAMERASQASRKYGYAVAEAGEMGGDSVEMLVGGLSSLLGVSVSLATPLAIVGSAIAVLALYAKLATGAFNLLKGVVQGVMNAIVSAVRTAVNAVKSLWNAFKGLLGLLERLTRPLRNFISGILQVAGGMSLYNTIRNISSAVGELSSEIFDAVVNFQKLEIQLSTLAARDYARATGAPMAVAFEKTANAAGNLFDWMRRLAVETPVGIEEISNVFALSQAMGFGVDKTKELTSATIDYASAVGLADEVVWRTIYNLGQMIQRGRVSGEEFKDLSRNLFPVQQVLEELAEEAGMTTEAFRELAVEGGAPVMDFVDKFIEIIQRDYPGAAEKMSRTISTATENIKDFFKTFLGADILKPVLDRIAGMMDDFLETLMNNEQLMLSTKVLGQVLLQAFEILTPAVDALVKALSTLFKALFGVRDHAGYATEGIAELKSRTIDVAWWAEKLAVNILAFAMLLSDGLTSAAGHIASFARGSTTTFASLSSRAYEWGIGFLESFAKGIATGIGYLTTVINWIADILETWFAPGSPPDIAPYIDRWGAEAMNQWIRGFALADFDMFDDIAGLVESYIRSMSSQIGGEDGINIVPRILTAREGIASALARVRAGVLGVNEAIRQMVSAIGVSQGNFTAYISTLFHIAAAERAVEEASRRVEDAQRAVNEVTQKYDSILRGLRNQLSEVTESYDEEVRLREIAEAIGTQRLTTEERERLEAEKRAIQIKRQIRDVEAQRDTELSVAEARLEAARQEEEAARRSLELLERRADVLRTQIEAMIEQNKLIEEQMKLLERLQKDVEEKVDDEDGIIPFDLIKAPSQEEMDRIFGNLDALMDEARQKADDWKNSLQNVFDILKSTGVGESFDNLKTAFENLKSVTGPLMGEDGVFAKLGTSWENLMKKLGLGPEENRFEKIVSAIEDVGERLVNASIKYLPVVFKWGSQLIDFGKAVVTAGGLIQSGAVRIALALGIIDKAPEDGKSFLQKLVEWADSVITSGLMKLAAVFATIAIEIQILATAVEILTGALSFLLEVIKDPSFENISEEFYSTLNNIFAGSIADLVSGIVESLVSVWSINTPAPFGDPPVRRGGGAPGRQYGGNVRRGMPYVVGEKRAEVFVPPVSGKIFPSLENFQRAMSPVPAVAPAPMNIDRSTHLEINPTYRNVQSEASIRHDALALLASVWR